MECLENGNFQDLESHMVIPCLVPVTTSQMQNRIYFKSLASYNLGGNSLSTVVYSFVTA